MDKNIARIMIYDDHASCEFSKPTSPTLKEKIKQLPWLKWRKKTVEDKEYWKLIINLSENKNNLNEFIVILQAEDVLCKIKESKDSDWKDYPVIQELCSTSGKDVLVVGSHSDPAKPEKDKKCFFYIQPSYYKMLSDLAAEKHMTFNQLIICACDAYLRAEKQAEPLKALDTSLPEGTFSEKVLMEIARRGSKRAWVADKLGIDRSKFYRMIDTDKWTKEDKAAVCNLFGWH